ncbi:MAG: AAA family ATPase, partial [Clostridiaceae bacterium]|nr:AAA family ATPase [Clostridiaceae bacterium]
MSVSPLSADSLRRHCDPSIFNFQDTSSLTPSKGLINQERAIRATKFAMSIYQEGFNIYMAGMPGLGKTRYAMDIAQKYANMMPVPDDWCYVYNFENPMQPHTINLPAGKGKEFKRDMESFVKIIEQEIKKAFEGEEYEVERNKILEEFRIKKEEYVTELSYAAAERGFKVKITNSGIYFLPVISGSPINEEDYNLLDEEIKMELHNSSEELQKETQDIVRKIRQIEMQAELAISEWENQIALYAVGIHIDDLKKKYKSYLNVIQYLDSVKKDILENINHLAGEDRIDSQQNAIYQIMLRKSGEENHYDKYRVNLLVDNSRLKGAPVIIDYNPNYYNLMGRCDYENEFGTVITDYTMIKPGLFHQANGGFLILHINDVLSNPQSMDAIKRTLKTRQIVIENIKEQMGLIAVSSLKPEPIPVNVKVILIGSSEAYNFLYNYDRDFKKYFRIKAEFDSSVDYNLDNIYKIAQFIAAYCRKEGLRHFDRTGVAEVINYCSWVVQDQDKLTVRFSEIVDILVESETWAKIEGSPTVLAKHVQKAIKEKRKRSNKYDEHLLKSIRDGTILIDTDGYAVGQINGLAVVDMGDYTFGKPRRITAATYMGKTGILDIEREVETGGVTHSKGVLILSGYIGKKYAQNIPLSLAASICFEQLYSGIEGDSASSTELFAILSSLSDLP